jgi:hypothetical protein
MMMLSKDGVLEKKTPTRLLYLYSLQIIDTRRITTTSTTIT